MLKKCKSCDVEHPISEFHRNRRSSDGHHYQCKLCVAVQRKGEYTGAVARRKRQYAIERRQNHQAVINEVKRAGCRLCEEKEISCMDFHHVDPTQKNFILGSENAGRSLASILAEIDKCVVLCANCHRKIHAGVICIIPAHQIG